MNGAEHYARAEQLEALAIEQWEKPGRQRLAELTMQQAQVHATLALAAAQPKSITEADVMRCAHGAIICGLCGYGVPAGDGGRA